MGAKAGIVADLAGMMQMRCFWMTAESLWERIHTRSGQHIRYIFTGLNIAFANKFAPTGPSPANRFSAELHGHRIGHKDPLDELDMKQHQNTDTDPVERGEPEPSGIPSDSELCDLIRSRRHEQPIPVEFEDL